MKILKKVKFQKNGKKIKKYKLFGLSVLRKEVLPFKKKWIFLGIKFCYKQNLNRQEVLICKRETNVDVIEKSNLFNKKYYLKQYPELKKQNIDLAEHYLKVGFLEGKNPSALFDNDIYLSYYPDIFYNKINNYIIYCNLKGNGT